MVCPNSLGGRIILQTQEAVMGLTIDFCYHRHRNRILILPALLLLQMESMSHGMHVGIAAGVESKINVLLERP